MEENSLIEIKAIDGLMLREMVLGGTALLEKNREKVDALNVFPVPDGDTGTNMSLTMASAVKEINAQEYPSIGKAAAALAKGALRGARGNSGVITSQLYRGFSRALEGLDVAGPVEFAAALKRGADTAYKAVMRPKEGTILTVARVIAEEAVKQAESAPDDFDALFNTILSVGKDILAQTPEMLPILKQAGVVDAGGQGLMHIYTGYAACLRGEKLDMEKSDDQEGAQAQDEAEEDETEDLRFTYSVRYRLVNVNKKAVQSDVDLLKRQLNRIGDYLKIKGTLPDLTVSVHTNDPGKALQCGQILGDLTDLELVNLAEARKAKEAAAVPAEPAPSAERKAYGMVTVSMGKGFSNIFRDLTVDAIVEGGQTMNPSIEDLQKAIEGVNADTVFVFPNNGNVVLAAQQAAELCDNRVIVIPTKNVAMGIAAAVAFQPDSTPEENEAHMTQAAEMVRTGTITYAVRDSEYEDLHIKQGDVIGLSNGKVSESGSSIHDVAVSLAKHIVTDDDSLITLYYGEDTKEEDARQLADEFEELYPDCDIELQSGGQPLYYYLIAVE